MYPEAGLNWQGQVPLDMITHLRAASERMDAWVTAVRSEGRLNELIGVRSSSSVERSERSGRQHSNEV